MLVTFGNKSVREIIEVILKFLLLVKCYLVISYTSLAGTFSFTNYFGG